MKAILPLFFLFAGWASFADAVRLDPAYLDDRVYTREMDEDALSEGVYSGEIDEPSLIQVQAMGANMGTCTLSTPPGVSCFCNHKVFRSRDHVELGWHFDGRHAVRDGWSATYYKGTHTAFCHRD
ncbi:MAG TPA: hypothetical protein VKY22_21180 [Bradyrhizobium sp.]|jgi:hypothetical protein|nr:hypothetical protein [Bradyrhizobium sp.]